MFRKILALILFGLTFVLVLTACIFFVDHRKTFKNLLYISLILEFMFYVELLLINIPE